VRVIFSEGLLNGSYLVGSVAIRMGAIFQIKKLLETRYAEGISLPFITFLFIGMLLLLPRAFNSPYWVWKVANVFGCTLVFIMLILVLRYSQPLPA